MKKKDTLYALKAIREVLLRHDVESCRLWDILSALRGPDDGNLDLKVATTAVIRATAFGEDAFFSLPACAAPDATDGPTWRAKTGVGHFRRHALSAFHALGLKWDEPNERSCAIPLKPEKRERPPRPEKRKGGKAGGKRGGK